MKKKLSLLLVLSLIFSLLLVGCGNNSKNNSKDTTKKEHTSSTKDSGEKGESTSDKSSTKTEITESKGPEEEYVDKDYLANYIIEHQGEIPEGITEDDVRNADLGNLIYMFVESIKDLDADNLQPYISERDYKNYSAYFSYVKDDEESVKLWKDTIGLIIYYPDSDILIGKDVNYVEAKWYTDCYLEEVEIPGGDADEFPMDYLLEIYEKYYLDAPYTAGKGADYKLEVIDGKVVFDIEDIFDSIGYEDLNDLCHYNPWSDSLMRFSYDTVFMGYGIGYSLGYNYIEDQTSNRATREDYIAFINKDLDYLIKKAEPYAAANDDGGNFYINAYYEYFDNGVNKDLIQRYIDDECEIFITVSDAVLYAPLSTNLYPLSHMTDAEKADLESKNLRLVDNFTMDWLRYQNNPINCFYTISRAMLDRKVVVSSNN